MTSFTTCGAKAAIEVEGVEVMTFACSLEFGHGDGGTPHRAVIGWEDEAIVDPDLLDPNEVADVVVPFDVPGPCLVEGCSLIGPHGVHSD